MFPRFVCGSPCPGRFPPPLQPLQLLQRPRPWPGIVGGGGIPAPSHYERLPARPLLHDSALRPSSRSSMRIAPPSPQLPPMVPCNARPWPPSCRGRARRRSSCWIPSGDWSRGTPGGGEGIGPPVRLLLLELGLSALQSARTHGSSSGGRGAAFHPVRRRSIR